jgi:hypothetical protein
VLSTQASLTLSWSYGGGLSPWNAPSIATAGTANFQGASYNQFLVTWSSGKAWNNGSPGSVGPGIQFHVGATFSGIDFNQPNPIIITAIALQDGGGAPLTLQPRMVGYDAGALDGSDGNFNFRFFNPDPARRLVLADVTVHELPRVLSIDSMVPGAPMKSWQGLPVIPWKSERRLVPPGQEKNREAKGEAEIRDVLKLSLAKMSQGRHIYINTTADDCKREPQPRGVHRDGTYADTTCRPGQALDLFPATALYLTATVIDPEARQWDAAQGKFVVGPLASRLYYQVGGIHPDLNHNGVDDYLDIVNGTSKDENHDGVPDEAQQPPAAKCALGPEWLWLLIGLAAVILLVLWLRRPRGP